MESEVSVLLRLFRKAVVVSPGHVHSLSSAFLVIWTARLRTVQQSRTYRTREMKQIRNVLTVQMITEKKNVLTSLWGWCQVTFVAVLTDAIHLGTTFEWPWVSVIGWCSLYGLQRRHQRLYHQHQHHQWHAHRLPTHLCCHWPCAFQHQPPLPGHRPQQQTYGCKTWCLYITDFCGV